MAEVLRPSTSTRSKRDSKEAYVFSLNSLLERYLHLLDRYQILQQSLSQLLSRVRTDWLVMHTTAHTAQGYLSLAQANFSNPNHVRYGQEVYDDRMQALALVYAAFSCFHLEMLQRVCMLISAQIHQSKVTFFLRYRAQDPGNCPRNRR